MCLNKGKRIAIKAIRKSNSGIIVLPCEDDTLNIDFFGNDKFTTDLLDAVIAFVCQWQKSYHDNKGKTVFVKMKKH